MRQPTLLEGVLVLVVVLELAEADLVVGRSTWSVPTHSFKRSSASRMSSCSRSDDAARSGRLRLAGADGRVLELENGGPSGRSSFLARDICSKKSTSSSTILNSRRAVWLMISRISANALLVVAGDLDDDVLVARRDAGLLETELVDAAVDGLLRLGDGAARGSAVSTSPLMRNVTRLADPPSAGPGARRRTSSGSASSIFAASAGSLNFSVICRRCSRRFSMRDLRRRASSSSSTRRRLVARVEAERRGELARASRRSSGRACP